MDRILYVVTNEQGKHLDRLCKTLELMGGKWAVLSKKLHHVTYGPVCSRFLS
jgi:arginyl-tRNA synthetase